MKFLSLAVFAGAAVAQVSVISDAIAAIQSQTTALDSAVNSFSGPGDITGLQNAATAVISAINTGNTNVQGIDPVTATDALTLVDPINALAGVVDTAVNDLISKKSALSAETGVVNQNLNQILDATNTFSATVFTKIPDSLVPTARSLVQPIIDDLNRAITNFPPGSTSTSSGSVAPSSSATASVSVSSSSGTASAPTYPTTTASGSASSVPTTLVSSTGAVTVSPTTISPPISTGPAPYNPNGASQLSGGFAAVVVAAAVAVAAF